MIKKIATLIFITTVSILFNATNTVTVRSEETVTNEELWKTDILGNLDESHYEQLVSAMVIDAETGQILLSKNVDEQFPTGDLSKLMLLYLTYEEMYNNSETSLTGGTKINASNNVYKYSDITFDVNDKYDIDYKWQSMSMYEGGKYSLDTLLSWITVHNANDASVAIAEHIKGSEHDFTNYMNENAEILGLGSSTFYNTTGLNFSDTQKYVYNSSEESDELYNTMSTQDVGKLTYKLISTYPQVINYSMLDSAVHPYEKKLNSDENRVVWSSNALLDDQKSNDEVDPFPIETIGVLGLITDTINPTINGETYYSYVNYYEQSPENKFISIVVTKTDVISESPGDGDDKAKDTSFYPYHRFRISKEILRYLTTDFNKVTVTNKSISEVDLDLSLPVYKGKVNKVNYQIDKDFSFFVKKNHELNYQLSVEKNSNYFNETGDLIAPLDKETVVGQAKLTVENFDLNYIDQDYRYALVDISIAEDVHRANIFKLAYIEISETIVNFVDWVKSLF